MLIRHNESKNATHVTKYVLHLAVLRKQHEKNREGERVAERRQECKHFTVGRSYSILSHFVRVSFYFRFFSSLCLLCSSAFSSYSHCCCCFCFCHFSAPISIRNSFSFYSLFFLFLFSVSAEFCVFFFSLFRFAVLSLLLLL